MSGKLRKRVKRAASGGKRPGGGSAVAGPAVAAPAVVLDARRPLLSLAMMVKDEEAFVGDALRSAQGFCDELVVVDTGSTDRTVEIARDLGATVSHFPWPGSFSEARNETLRRASGHFVAILDADERFRGDHPALIRPHLRPGPSWPFQALLVNVVNTELDGSVISSFFSARFFPRDPRIGYHGRVHNRFGALTPDAPRIDGTRYLGLDVVHLGYDPGLYAARKKAARSLPLIEQTVREEPDNLQYRFYLGREYLLLDRFADAIAVLEPAVERMAAVGDGVLVEASTALLRAYRRAGGCADRASVAARRALSQHETHPDLWYEWGATMAAERQFSAARELLERARASLGVEQARTVQIAHRPWVIDEALGEACWALSAWREAYTAYSRAVAHKPAGMPGWPALLNSTVALAIELNDAPAVRPLLERLLDHPEAPLGMFFHEVQRLTGAVGPDAGRALLRWGRARCPRVWTDPEYAGVARQLGELEAPPDGALAPRDTGGA